MNLMVHAPELGYKDSNLEMTESESVALPFGDTPIVIACRMHYVSIMERLKFCKHFFTKMN